MRLLPVELGPVESLLDVGCGIRPADFIECRRYVGIDAHRPYIDAIDPPAGGALICAEWDEALARFSDGEFELVLALDFIEHLEREEGECFLEEARRVGRRVVIFTPHGEMPQSFESERDQWGMDGAHWQTHRSAWTPDDFEDWTTYVLPGFHGDIDAFWALWTS